MTAIDTGWQPKSEAKPKSKTVTVRAVIEWAELTRVNKLSNKYQVNLTQLSDAAVNKLAEDLNVTARNKDGVSLITAKSSNPIKAYDADDKELDVLIGNGSVAEVTLSSYNWTSPAGQKGTSPSIVHLKITELVEFESSSGSSEVF